MRRLRSCPVLVVGDSEETRPCSRVASGEEGDNILGDWDVVNGDRFEEAVQFQECFLTLRIDIGMGARAEEVGRRVKLEGAERARGMLEVVEGVIEFVASGVRPFRLRVLVG
jgi:hypothetical protein